MRIYLDYWTRAFDFSGRSTPIEFWLPVAINTIFLFMGTLFVQSLSSYLDLKAGRPPSLSGFVFSYVLQTMGMLPGLALRVRRLHDIGVSGSKLVKYILLIAIPFVGVLAYLRYLVVMSSPSTSEENDWGVPRTIEPEEESNAKLVFLMAIVVAGSLGVASKFLIDASVPNL